MKCINNKMTDIEIAYIGGGSRGWAWTFMTDLALEESLSGNIRLYDIDVKAAQNNEIIGNKIKEREEAKGIWSYQVKSTLKEALEGVDFVVISILPKTFEEMEIDVHLPEKYGIYQSVGDTAGPGGMVRGLRTIPMFVEIANAIKEYSPNAWVVNYTNPMSLCIKTLYETFSDIKAFGCCHEVFGTQKVLAGIAEKELGIEKIERNEINVNVLGINHFTWFDRASYQGMDLFPIYKKYIDKHFEEGYKEESEHWANASFACMHRVKMDLFLKYGNIAAAGDRHLVEFMPGEEYLKDKETVEKWKYGLTTVSWRKEDLVKRVERSNRLASGEEEIKLTPTGEEGILLIKALCGLGRIISNVNMPNKHAQIENLPKNAIVETNAVFDRDMIYPIYAGNLPEEIKELTLPHVKNHELIYQAAIEKNWELVVDAFGQDPLVRGRMTKEEIKELVYEMIEKTK